MRIVKVMSFRDRSSVRDRLRNITYGGVMVCGENVCGSSRSERIATTRLYFNFDDRFDFNYLIVIISTSHNDFTRSTPHLPVNFTSIWNYKGHWYAHFWAITEKGLYEGPAF